MKPTLKDMLEIIEKEFGKETRIKVEKIIYKESNKWKKDVNLSQNKKEEKLVPCPSSPCQAEKRGDKTPLVKQGEICTVCKDWSDGW